MLNEFIEKVIVYEGEGRGNDRRQRIDIYLNFIGAFEVPAHIVTPEELEAEEKRLAHSREWQKEWREKRNGLRNTAGRKPHSIRRGAKGRKPDSLRQGRSKSLPPPRKRGKP